MRLKTLLFALSLTVLAACGPMARTARQETAAPAQEAATATADWVWAYSQAHPDGFTVDIRDRKVPTEGISVAYAATQDRHSKEDLGDVVSHALAHDGYVCIISTVFGSSRRAFPARPFPSPLRTNSLPSMCCPRARKSASTM